jgi:hypothetical protein
LIGSAKSAQSGDTFEANYREMSLLTCAVSQGISVDHDRLTLGAPAA